MPQCIKVKKQNRQICAGDMRDKIIIQVRSITPPDTTVDFTETFNQDVVVWSMLQTKMGVEIFDGTTLKGVATHYFYIRYRADLTSESWVKFNSKYYDILDVQNLEERNEFLLLRCSLRGTTSSPVNYA